MAIFLRITRGQTADFIRTNHPLKFTLLFSPSYFHPPIFTLLFLPTSFHLPFFTYLFPPKSGWKKIVARWTKLGWLFTHYSSTHVSLHTRVVLSPHSAHRGRTHICVHVHSFFPSSAVINVCPSTPISLRTRVVFLLHTQSQRTQGAGDTYHKLVKPLCWSRCCHGVCLCETQSPGVHRVHARSDASSIASCHWDAPGSTGVLLQHTLYRRLWLQLRIGGFDKCWYNDVPRLAAL